MKKLSIDELTRLAFVWAEQDREAMAGSWPKGSAERARASAMAAQLRAYRTKRWGRTQIEAILSKAKTKSVFKL